MTINLTIIAQENVPLSIRPDSGKSLERQQCGKVTWSFAFAVADCQYVEDRDFSAFST